MALKVDYYSALSRAVGAIDRDSYAARGAVYDREHKALMRRLFSADPPLPDEEIDQELQSFREAVRRIEFGEEENQVTLVPQRGPIPDKPLPPPAVAAPPAGRRQERDWSADFANWSQRIPSREPTHWSQRKTMEEPAPAPAPAPEPTHWSQRKPAEEPAPAAPPEPVHWSQRVTTPPEPAWTERGQPPGPNFDPPPGLIAADDDPPPSIDLRPRRRSVFGRVVRRALLAIVLLGLGLIAYDFMSGDVSLPKLATRARDSATSGLSVATLPQQAVIFDSNPPNPDGPKAAGNAVWRMRTEPLNGQREGGAVLQFDLKIPDRHLTLAMSMRREVPGSAMSHMVELRFLREDQQPDGDIDNIAPIVMTTVEQKEPAVLVGQVVKVTPGVFLFGLSGEAKDREQNERYLKEMTWLDIPIVYRNGFTGVLGIEKGVTGERAVNDAFGQWSK